MIELLRADGPSPEYADKLMLFGRLVGSWDIEGKEPGSTVSMPAPGRPSCSVELEALDS
jgi:hypothetical protein